MSKRRGVLKATEVIYTRDQSGAPRIYATGTELPPGELWDPKVLQGVWRVRVPGRRWRKETMMLTTVGGNGWEAEDFRGRLNSLRVNAEGLR